MARVYESKGQFAQALECFERAYTAGGKNPLVLADWRHCHGAMGEHSPARVILAQLSAIAAEGYLSPLALATADLGLGERQATLDCLAKAVEERTRGLIWANVARGSTRLRKRLRSYIKNYVAGRACVGCGVSASTPAPRVKPWLRSRKSG
jgi:tetratricopeptide (TPR) repeat protein